MPALRQLFRRAKTLLWTTLSIVIIFAAMLVGLGKLLMPYSERFQPRLEAWLSEEFGQQVTLASFEGEWNAFGPRLSLEGLRFQALAGGAGDIVIERAALDIKPLNALIPGRALYSFLLIGVNVSLTRTTDDHFAVSGIGIRSAGGQEEVSGFAKLGGAGALRLEDSTLEYVDRKRGVHLNLGGIDARLQLSGEELAVSLRANVIDGITGLAFGDLDGTGVLARSSDGKIASAKWHVNLRELELSQLQGRLPSRPFLPQSGSVDGEFWGDWLPGAPLRISGLVDLRDGILRNGDEQIDIAHLNTGLKWEFSGAGNWRVDFSDFQFDDGRQSWNAPRIALARNRARNLGLWLSADYLPLDMPMRLTRGIVGRYNKPWPESVPTATSGEVTGLDLVLDQKYRPRFGRGTVHQASFTDWGRWPDIRGVDGTFDLVEGAGSFELHAGRLQMEWPRVFPEPLEFSVPACSGGVVWGDRVQVDIVGCSLLNDDVALEGDFSLLRNGGRPFVDLNVRLPRARIGQLAPYWPRNLMRDTVIAWLERALQAGYASDGRVQIRGDLDHWPFRNGEGVFEATAEVREAELAYTANWPAAKGITATTRFNGPSLEVIGVIADVGGAPVQEARAFISDLKAPLLVVEYRSQTQLDSLVGFLHQSPLRQLMSEALVRFEFAGPATTTGVLRVPFGSQKGELKLDGELRLADNRYFDPVSGVVLQNVKGALRYTRQELVATGLAAVFKGQPAILGLRWDAQSEERFHAELAGVFDVQDMIPQGVVARFPELERVQGQTAWTLSVQVPAAQPGKVEAAILGIRSDLLGVEFNLPAPLQKSAGLAWPLALHYPLGDASRVLDIELDQKLFLQLDLGDSNQGGPLATGVTRASVRLGKGEESLPAAGFLRIAGDTESLDLDGWVDLLTARAKRPAGLGGLALERCELTAGSLYFLDRTFDSTGLAVSVVEPDIRAEFSGADISGHVLFNPAGSATGSLTAEFERLALAKPIHGGVEMDQDPSQLPVLHLYAKSFRYGDIELGETRIEAYPVANGFHFEKVESESPEVTLRASGDWLLGAGGYRSDFNILMTAESLGGLMQSVGISSSLEGGQAVLRVNAWWPGSPAAFAMPRLNGELEFSVTRGQITNASAGGGRLLGLLSIQALPRRLSLDFRDVFDAGFDFDEAKGTFRMENGTATTDDVLLSSSVAKISLSGTTDLVMQQYDQLMTVRPGVGNTLPVIGAIAGGPGGAAAGLALQGLLQKQLGEATQVQYSITGSWDEPAIEPVLKENTGG